MIPNFMGASKNKNISAFLEEDMRICVCLYVYFKIFYISDDVFQDFKIHLF